MKKCVLLLALFSLPTLALDCDLYTSATQPSEELVEINYMENAGICVSLNSEEPGSEHLLTFDAEADATPSSGEYWDGWLAADVNDSSPFLTQQMDNSYLGVGVWMPADLAAREEQMTTEEWVKSHGLKLSLGFGQKKTGEPRVRLDYRWHEVYQADWFMQVEVPF